MQKGQNRFSAKQLLLIDGLGALTTAGLLILLLANYEAFFGMPPNVLYRLSVLALIMSSYGLLSFMFVRSNHRRFLKPIVAANVLYCLITAAAILFHRETITIYGIAYFIGEFIIVGILVDAEYRALRDGPKRSKNSS